MQVSPPVRRAVRRSAITLGGGLFVVALALSPLSFTPRAGSMPGAWEPPREALPNGGVEEQEPAWGLIEPGTRVAAGEGRRGSRAIACAGPDRRRAAGAFQTVLLEQSRAYPL